jgi:hypothetical protein
MHFNRGLREIRSEMMVPNEDHPDSSLIVALESGDLDDDTASHVRAHMLFCESCLEDFFCLRRSARGESWDLVEKLKESLIDLGATYGTGVFRGLAKIITETPALALRGEQRSSGIFKVLEVTIAANQYSIEVRLAEDGSLSFDIAGFRTLVRAPLKIIVESETGEEMASIDSEDSGNAQLTIPHDRLVSDLYVLTLSFNYIEQHLLFRVSKLYPACPS